MPPLIRAPFRILYGLYTWTVFLILSLLALLGMLIVPGVDRRRRIARLTARTFLAAAGMRLRPVGLEGLPGESCIVVANHASYLDGVIMIAVLPPRFGFVIKKEMDRVPLGPRDRNPPVVGEGAQDHASRDRLSRAGRSRSARRLRPADAVHGVGGR